MDTVDWAALSRLVPEAVLVVIFGFFVLRLLERQDRRDKARDQLSEAHEAARDAREATRDAAYLNSLEKRDLEWQRFMERQEMSHAKAITRSVDEIEKLGHLVTATNTLIVQHDTWARNEADRRRATP